MKERHGDMLRFPENLQINRLRGLYFQKENSEEKFQPDKNRWRIFKVKAF